MSPDSLIHFLESCAEVRNNECWNKETNKKIKACIPMHNFGHPLKIDEIILICKKYHISVIEDAAESLGSIYKGKHTGIFAQMGILSFNGNKIITTGGGGMILTDDEMLAERAKHITTTGKKPHPWLFIHDEIAFNYRLPNISAALGLGQFASIEKIFLEKKRIYERYKKNLKKEINIPKNILEDLKKLDA